MGTDLETGHESDHGQARYASVPDLHGPPGPKAKKKGGTLSQAVAKFLFTAQASPWLFGKGR